MVTADVTILDDCPDLRLVLSMLLESHLGVSCAGFATLGEMQSQRGAVLASRLVILDVNLGERQPSGVDALQWLRTEKFPGSMLFLTGHARTNPLVREAAATGTRVIEKPFQTHELIDVVRHCLSRDGTCP